MTGFETKSRGPRDEPNSLMKKSKDLDTKEQDVTNHRTN